MKTFRKVKNVLIVLSVMGMLSACKDYLEQPVNGGTDPSNFYKTEDDFTKALTAVYDAYSTSYDGRWASIYLLREIPSDDANAGGSDGNDQATYQHLDDFTHDSQADWIEGGWNNLWATLYR